MRLQLAIVISVVLSLGVGGLAFPLEFAEADGSVVGLLDRYERGEHLAVVDELIRGFDAGRFARDLRTAGGHWTESLGPLAAHRRRLVAATVALEAASLRFWPEEVDPLVEWGCLLLRSKSEHDESERRWFRASVAIFGRARDDGKLVRGGTQTFTGRLPPVARLADHVAHAREEWPNEARFRLAQGMLAAASADTEPARDAQWIGTEALFRNSPEGLRRARASQAIQMFGALLDVPSLKAEAAVRLGYLYLTLNEPQEALKQFREAQGDTDPFVAYLAWFLSGRALDRMGQPAQALEVYREALSRVPHAQSASEALAADLFAAGQIDEAYTVAQDGLSTRGLRADPWHEFGYGDLRFIPALMSQLREAIK